MTENTQQMYTKVSRLEEILRSLGKVAVAYSSGVDSTCLLYTARRVLGENVLAVTAEAPIFPARERNAAADFCKRLGIRHLTLPFRPLELPAFQENPADRCYHCKTALFRQLMAAADEAGFPTVAEGTNVDDLSDYRPGLRAIEELGILSPLKEAGLTKREIRILSRESGLPTWDQPSFACLASRFATGDPITGERLAMVEEAESYLASLGLRQYRVRLHDSLARIETEPEEMQRLTDPEVRGALIKRFRSLGFRYVTLDLSGYQTGSMNKAHSAR